MKLLFLLSLFLFVSCASRPERHIASEEVIELGEVEVGLSQLRLYPVENQEQSQHQFYLELLNGSKSLVDVDLRDIQVRHKSGKSNFEVKRIAKGKYQIDVSEEYSELTKLKFSVQGKDLKNNLLTLPRPARNNSQIVVLSNQHHELKLRLILKDKLGKEVEVAQSPEIQFEGQGDVSELQKVKSGVWEFSVIYPEQNQICYISVRANGAHFRRILRFHHIEK